MTIPARNPAPLMEYFADDRSADLHDAGKKLREALNGRRIVNVNATPGGGGVVEMFSDLLPYVRGAGIDCRWLVIDGDPAFFDILQRIEARIYGYPGDPGALDAAARRHYERVHDNIAQQAERLLRPDDILILHDHQPLGLAPALVAANRPVIWRCHLGTDKPNEFTEEAWHFLRPYLDNLDRYVFSRKLFVPDWLPTSKVVIIPPTIDPSGLKNQPMRSEIAGRVLAWCGLRQGDPGTTPVSFTRRDGSPGLVRRRADVLQSGPPAPADAPLVVQVSRWDPLKDMTGVMTAFADNLANMGDAHLAVVGPAVAGVAGQSNMAAATVLDCMSLWRRLPHEARARVHLACLPVADPEENAFVVNAIQRMATVVTQKSLSEGFGMTVTEAMWKAKPVVASAVGGIQDQITADTGVLVAPDDLDAFARALAGFLSRPDRVDTFGRAAQKRVRDAFLPDRHLIQFADLINGVL